MNVNYSKYLCYHSKYLCYHFHTTVFLYVEKLHAMDGFLFVQNDYKHSAVQSNVHMFQHLASFQFKTNDSVGGPAGGWGGTSAKFT